MRKHLYPSTTAVPCFLEPPSPPSSDDDLEVDTTDRPERREKFTFFFTKRFAFSNHRECELEIDGRNYTCTEHYYMRSKAKTFGDCTRAERIQAANDPREMKVEAKCVKGFNREEWITLFQIAMIQRNLEKFKQNYQLRLALLRTYGTTLVECNPADQRWGIAMPFTDENKNDRSKWKGHNWLGEILTAIRKYMWRCGKYCADVERVKDELRIRRKHHRL